MKIQMIGADAVDNDCVRRITQEWGHQLVKAKTGKEVLTLGAEKDYDLILLDVFLPDRKGYELIPEVRRKWPACQIFTVTAVNTRELESNVRKEGVDYYMRRPFDNVNLESIIGHLAQKTTKRSKQRVSTRSIGTI